MDTLIKTEEHGNHTVEIHLDPTPQNPMDTQNYLSKILIWSEKYKDFGTKDARNLVPDPWVFKNELDWIAAIQKTLKPLVCFKITIGTDQIWLGGTSDWTPNECGVLLILRDDLPALGYKVATKNALKTAEDIAKTEFESYKNYLKGEVYGFIIKNSKTNKEVDSCWGFYDEQHLKETIEYQIQVLARYQSLVREDVQFAKGEQKNQFIMWVENKVIGTFELIHDVDYHWIDTPKHWNSKHYEQVVAEVCCIQDFVTRLHLNPNLMLEDKQ